MKHPNPGIGEFMPPEALETEENGDESRLLNDAHAAAFSSASLPSKQQKIDDSEDQASKASDAFMKLQTFYDTNTAAIQEASQGLAAAANLDIHSVEASITRFAETSTVIMSGLDALGAVHPFIGVAVIVFKAVISLDLTRRQNNKKVLAMKLQMQDVMLILFELRSVRDPEHKAPDGTKLKDQFSEILKSIARDITECGNVCDVYLKENFFSKTIHSKGYEEKFAAYVASFEEHKKNIVLRMQMHVTLSQDIVKRHVENQSTQLDRIESLIKELFRKFGTAEENAARKILERGSIEASLDDDATLHQLVLLSGDSTWKSKDISETRDLLKKMLADDIQEAFRKNERLFEGKMELQSQQLEAAIIASEERIVNLLQAGAHDDVLDPDLQALWKRQRWNSSVEGRTFVLGIYDYYSEQQDSRATASQTPTIADIPLLGMAHTGRDDTWALKLISNVSLIQPILETVDDDGTGFVTIKEANEFARSRPQECSLLAWIAYWAAGWHGSITSYKNRIYTLLQAMYGLAFRSQRHVLGANIQQVDRYLASVPLRKIELLLRSTRSARPVWDKHLNKLRMEIEESETERIKIHLDRSRYKLSPRSIKLVTGSKRIERFIYPLLFEVLQRHLDRLRLACVRVLDNKECGEMLDALIDILKPVHDRVTSLEAVFSSSTTNLSERFGSFSFGMFQAWYENKNQVDVSQDTIRKYSGQHEYPSRHWEKLDDDIYSSDVYKRLDDSRAEILRYPTLDASKYNYDPSHARFPHEGRGNRHKLAGQWTGHFGNHRSDCYFTSLALSVHDDRTISGTALDLNEKTEFVGSFEPGNQFYLRVAHELKSYVGYYDPVSDTISLKFDAYTAAAFYRTAPESYRFRPSASASTAGLALARWRFAISAVLDQVQRKNLSESWLKARGDERRRFIELTIREDADTMHVGTPWPLLTRDEQAELSHLKAILTPEDARFYLQVADSERSKFVKHDRRCDVCRCPILVVRVFCVQCMNESYTECVNLCGQDMHKPVAWKKDVTHLPSHALVKTTVRLHNPNLAWIVRQARMVAEQAKTFFKDPAYAASSYLASCNLCYKPVSLPVWACTVCSNESRLIYICDECHETKQQPRSHERQHLLTHPLVYVHDFEPLMIGMSNEEIRILGLEQRMSKYQENTLRIEQRSEESATRMQDKLVQMEAKMDRMMQLLIDASSRTS
ncbi:unnamed protein product [Mycena citricolor]|uniref:EF-hand domain-containing protein n=1 Tax=Mycena citricolor TaxID=2018698 RepID=A0AAD2HAE8_9AGAR|nr:unnamed protein product [Mycena citricolor]